MIFCTEKIKTCSGVSRVNLKEGQGDKRFAVSFIFTTRTRDFTIFFDHRRPPEYASGLHCLGSLLLVLKCLSTK